jgi:hypothetical protein
MSEIGFRLLCCGKAAAALQFHFRGLLRGTALIDLNLDRYKKARVWVGELPELSYDVLQVEERRLAAQGGMLAEVRCAAVELLIPTGPRSLYGALGATFSPGITGQLLVQVATSAEDGELVASALTGRLDEVHIGLPQEYAGAVLEGAVNTEEIHLLGPGILRFDHAAHGYVSSAQVIFRRVARTVVRLLCLDEGAASEGDLRAILERED